MRAMRHGSKGSGNSAAALAAALMLAACDPQGAPAPPAAANPVAYFEIPVTDMDRAMRFYTGVFNLPLSRRTIDGYDMALFPRTDGAGASGALARGDIYVPAKTGPVIYFGVADIDVVLGRARQRGARILYPKKPLGDGSAVAEIEDSEGNRIALLQSIR